MNISCVISGATTAIFGLVHGILIRPLDYRQPDRLVMDDLAVFEALAGGHGLALHQNLAE